MKNLVAMALNESLDRLKVVSRNNTQTLIELRDISNKYQEDIRTISSLISMTHNVKNTSENKGEMVEALEKLMLSKQKDVSELRKMIDYAESSSNELTKAVDWIKTTSEEKS